MLPSEHRLMYLAGAVADGTPVDWAKELESTSNVDDRRIIERLQAVAALADVHRSTESSSDHSTVQGQPGRISWGPLQLRRVIGRGSFGTIYLAWDPGLEVEVVVKILEQSDRTAALFQEARLLARVRHPNVVTVHRVEEFDGVAGLEMEYVDGLSLKQVLQERGVFGAHEAALVGIDVCRAVAAVHKAGLVHRDVKAQNVMREAGGRIVLMDFGAGEGQAGSVPSKRITGTPLYLSPEVLAGQSASTASDIYSIGVLLYHMLTLRYPVEGDSLDDLEVAHARHQITPIGDRRPDLPAGIVHVIGRALHPDPVSRPRSAGAMQEELLATIAATPHLRSETGESIATTDSLRPADTNALGDVKTARSVWRRIEESRWLKVAAAVVLLGLLAVPVAWMYRNRSDQSAIGTLLPDRKIVVVLPFRLIGEGREDRVYYSEGVSEVLTSSLAQLGLPDLQIMPSSEIRDGRIDTIEKARAEFGATLVLSGVVQFAGNQVRLSYALIRAADRRELTARSKTLAAGDPFAVQDVVTRDALAMLGSSLTAPPQEAQLAFGTRDNRAFFLYTQARGALQDYHKQENVDAAIRFLKEAIGRDPRYAAAYAGLGRALWENFNTSKQSLWLDQAGEACEKSSDLNPQLSEAQLCLGLVEESKGAYEAAIESYQRAIDYSASNDEALRQMGSVLDKLERVDEAENAYLRAIELRPGYWAGYARIAQFYTLRNDYQKAGEYYEKALKLSPNNARVLYSIGLVFASEGQYERAIEYEEKAIQFGPYLAPPATNLGLAYLRARRYNEAVPQLEKAFSLRADYQTAGNLARIYRLTGRTDDARQKYEFGIRDGEQRLQQNQRDHAVHVLLGRYYAMLGRGPEALSHINQALLLHPRDAHYLTIAATAYLALGDRNMALSLIEQAAKLGHTAAQFLAEPELDVLKAEPRYIAAMAVKDPGR
jgi:tetratricopeptide (TPR) repeat protein/TolB-like protein/predicted Ser/Thr protein kinase